MISRIHTFIAGRSRLIPCLASGCIVPFVLAEPRAVSHVKIEKPDATGSIGVEIQSSTVA